VSIPNRREYILEELVIRARDGESEAFEQLAAAHLRDLYRTATAIVGSSDARDVTQEALVAAWRELPRLRRAERFSPWLRKILLNRCRNHLRAAARRADATLRLSTSLEERSMGPSRESTAEISDALAALPLPQRTVITLHYVIGLPLREVAETLAVPQGTVQSRLHAGLVSLRKALLEESG
jgi:RNA polymerase sigma factor (sigma-70 family)